MESGAPIAGGYVLLARATLDSRLWTLGADACRLAEWLLLSVRYEETPKRYPGFEVARGEVVTSLSDMANGCAWFENRKIRTWNRSKVARILEKLAEIGFCEVISDTFGTHVRVCNYARYQAPDMYNSDNRRTTVGQPRDNCRTTARTLKEREEGEELIPPCKSPKGDDTDAEAIYAEYPRKVAKQPALAAIRKALRDTAAATLLERTKDYAKAVQGAEPRFIPHPATWYNQRRWEDPPGEWAMTGRHPAQPRTWQAPVPEPEYRTRPDPPERTPEQIEAANRFSQQVDELLGKGGNPGR